MHSGPAKHLSDLLTFVEARVDESSGELASATKISAIDEIDRHPTISQAIKCAWMKLKQHSLRPSLLRVPKWRRYRNTKQARSDAQKC